MNERLEVPSLEVVDREIRRRRPPERLDFLSDGEADELRGALGRRDMRTAARLVRRAELRIRHKLPGSTFPRPPGVPSHLQTQRFGHDFCLGRVDWQPGQPDSDCECVLWTLDGPEADGGRKAIFERHRYVARVREERRKRREAPPVEVVPRLPGGRWQTAAGESDPDVVPVRGRPVPGTPLLRVLDGGRDGAASGGSPAAHRLPPRGVTTDELAAVLGVPITDVDVRAPPRRAPTTNGDPNTSNEGA